MRPIKTFDPSLVQSDIIDTAGINPDEQIVLYNDSLVGLQLTFTDGSVDVLPASWNKSFTIASVAMGKIKWTQQYVIPATGYPISSVYGTVYESGEHVADVNAGMQRGFQLTGGAIISGASNQLINTGNPVGTTNIIEIQPTGDSGFTTLLDNVGNFVLGDILHPGSFSADNAKLLSNGAGILQMVGALIGVAGIDFSNLTGGFFAGVSGNVRWYEAFVGNYKALLVRMAIFQNGAVTLALPKPFNNGGVFFSDGIGLSGDGGVQLLSGVTPQNIKIINTLAAAGGSVTTQTSIFQYSLGFDENGFDGIGINNMTSTHTGFFAMIGQ